jgi:hypothetical protein
MREPLVVKTYYYWDGGTLGIKIQDAQQTELRLSFPSEYRRDSEYTKLFVGALYKQIPPMTGKRVKIPAMTEITPMEPTAEYLRDLLRSRVDDPTIAFALSCLSDRPHERMRPLINRYIHNKTPKSYLY